MNAAHATGDREDLFRPAAPAGYPSWLSTAGIAGLALLAVSRRRTLAAAALAGGAYYLYRRGAFDEALRDLPRPDWSDARRLADSLTDRVSSLMPSQLAPSHGPAGSSPARREFVPPDDADAVTEASMESFPASDPPASY